MSAEDLERRIRNLRGGADGYAASPDHSYRNYDPANFRGILDEIDALDDQQAQVDLQRDVRGVLKFIEGGRWNPMLKAGSQFFSKLDEDEQFAFTRRNPDLVEWIDVWERANGLGGYPRTAARQKIPMEPLEVTEREDFVAWARRTLSASREVNRVGLPIEEYDRIPQSDYEPPLYKSGWRSFSSARIERYGLDRDLPPGEQVEPMLRGFINRRKSYRNWSPQEVWETLLEGHHRDDEIELTRGMLRSLNWSEVWPNVDLKEEFDADEGIPVRRGTVAQQVIGLIEKGRFEAFLDEVWSVYRAFDPDEIVTFALRNPGVVTWLGVWGSAAGYFLDPSDGLFRMSSREWPLLGEKDNPGNPHNDNPGNPNGHSNPVYESDSDARAAAERMLARTPGEIRQAQYIGYFDPPTVFFDFFLPSRHPQTISREHFTSSMTARAESGELSEATIRFPALPSDVVSAPVLENFLRLLNPDNLFRARVQEHGGEWHPHLHYSGTKRDEFGPPLPDLIPGINQAIKRWYNEIDSVLQSDPMTDMKDDIRDRMED